MCGKTEPFQLFPEYYDIMVKQFNDIARDKLDKWIYYQKNNEIPDNFDAKVLFQACEILKHDNLIEPERS